MGFAAKGHIPGRWRLIMDPSHPEGGSVGIPPEWCSRKYSPGGSASFADITPAYRLVPVHIRTTAVCWEVELCGALPLWPFLGTQDILADVTTMGPPPGVQGKPRTHSGCARGTRHSSGSGQAGGSNPQIDAPRDQDAHRGRRAALRGGIAQKGLLV